MANARILIFRTSKRAEILGHEGGKSRSQIDLNRLMEARALVNKIDSVVDPLNKALGFNDSYILKLQEKCFRKKYPLSYFIEQITSTNESDWRRVPDLYKALVNEFLHQLFPR